MKFDRQSFFAATFGATILAGFAQAQTSSRALPDFDFRDRAASGAAALSEEAASRRAALAAALAGARDARGWPVRFTLDREGWPATVVAEHGLGAESARDAEEIARDFLFGPNRLSPFAPEQAGRFALLRRTRAGAVEALLFEQRIGGAPVYGSVVKVAVGGDGRVRSASFAEPVAGALLDSSSVPLAAAAAARKALEDLGVAADDPLDELPELGRRRRFAHPERGAGWPVLAEPVAVSVGGGARRAWRVFADAADGSYLTIVDATTGAILIRENLAREIGSARVFVASPDAGPSEVVAFPEGWLPPDASVTTGNNADAYLDARGDNRPDPIDNAEMRGGRAFSESRAFEFPTGDGMSAGALYRPAAIANAFYQTNRAHDYFYELGFREEHGNFQQDNFDRGGKGGDPVLVEVHDPAVRNNANFATRPDGEPGRMQLGLWSPRAGVSTDSAYQGTLVFHEYAHGVTNRLVGGPETTGCLGQIQGGALGEAWSDYFGASFFEDPVVGSYVGGNRERGIRRAAIDDNPRGFADLGDPRFAVHPDGEIFGSTLWDIRNELGKEAADRLVVDALQVTPCRPTYIDAREAILTADGGANRETLWRIFARRGMGIAAGAGNLTSAVRTVFDANEDLPGEFQPGNSAPAVTSRPGSAGLLGEPFSYTVRSLDLDGDAREYRLVSGPAGVEVGAASGELTWASPLFTTHRIQVEVRDGKGGRTVHGFDLNVGVNLVPGTPRTISGRRLSFGLAFFNVPAETKILQVRLRGASGDAHLVVFPPAGGRLESSFNAGSNETLSYRDPLPGSWVARVEGALDYENVTVEAVFLTAEPLEPGTPIRDLSDAETSERFYRVSVPEGTPHLRVTTAGRGDVDIVVSKGKIPLCGSLASSIPCDFDEISDAFGSYEAIEIANPSAGDYFVTLHGFRAYREVELRASFAPSTVRISGVTDGAAFQTRVAPGGIATIFGEGLSDETVMATTLPLPTTMGGARVVVDGVEAPLFFVSPGQVNFQTPFESIPFGSLSIFASRSGEVSAERLAAASFNVPQIFQYDSGNGALAPIVTHHATGRLVTPAEPLTSGGIAVVYFTGLGLVSNPPPTGQPAAADPLSRSLVGASATIGGAPAQVVFVGLTPGFAGLAQANLIAPDPLPPGNLLPLRLAVGSAAAAEVQLPTRP